MFAGLVATASSRSSSHGSATPLSPAADDALLDEAAVDRRAPSFSSPLATTTSTAVSSPRTDRRRWEPPESSEFLSPYSVGGYLTPSTGVRQRHVHTAQREQSPVVLRSWGTLSAGREEDENDEGEVEVEGEAKPGKSGKSSTTDNGPPSPSSTLRVGAGAAVVSAHHAAVMEEEEERKDGERERQLNWAAPGGQRVSLSPLSSSAPSTADGDTNLEKLAKQRSSSSASSVSAPAPPATSSFPPKEKPQPQLQSQRLPCLAGSSKLTADIGGTSSPKSASRVLPSSQPVAASVAAVAAAARTNDATHAASHAGSLSPTTPSFAAVGLFPLLPAETHDTAVVPLTERKECSCTCEGDRSLAIASPAATFSPASERSTPCAPPPDSPPDSAMKRPASAVTMEGTATTTDDGPSARFSEDDAVLSTRSVPSLVPYTGSNSDEHRHNREGGALFFGVLYTEEEHRVQLETQETEERRCLFRVHKAVILLYRMWAAEGGAHCGDGMSIEGHASAPCLIADHAPAPAPAPLDKAAAESINSNMVSATERVQHFLNVSIDSARERRSGSVTTVTHGEAAIAASFDAAAPPPHRTTTPRIIYSSDCFTEEDEEGRRQPSSTTFAAPPLLGSTTVASSPPASRVLDYSSLLAPVTHTPADNSFAFARRERRQPGRQSRHTRLFSPWRIDRSTTRSSPLQTVTTSMSTSLRAEEEDVVGQSGSQHDFHRSDGGGVRSFSPLIPRIRLTSPLGARAATAAVTASSTPRTGQFDYDASADMDSWRRGKAHLSYTSPLPPSSVLSDAFLSFTSRRAAEAGEPVAASAHAVPLTPALVRSPRATLVSTSLPSPTRRRTPPWNTSPNLRSTAAASRRVSLVSHQHDKFSTTNTDAAATTTKTPSPESLGFVPNRAFRERQRAASLSPPGRTASPIQTTLLQQQRNDEIRRRERLMSYVQYKRFFDAMYGARRTSPARSTSQQSSLTSARYQTMRSAATGLKKNESGDVVYDARSAALHRDDRRSQPLPSAYDASLPQRTPALAPSSFRAWSPDAYPRRAVPHPTRYRRRSSSFFAHTEERLSSALASFDEVGGTSGNSIPLRRDVYTARLSRLCTLEQLCRAELQRRWMEDQNALLHRFIMEGTAALQRARAANERRRDGVSGGEAVARQGRRRGQSLMGDVLEDARAWTFIPSEIE